MTAEGAVYPRPVVEAWIRSDPSPADAAELSGLLAAAEDGDEPAAAELRDRFAGPLAFGTAGLRGPLRAGPNGMNTAVVRRAARGLADYLLANRPAPAAADAEPADAAADDAAAAARPVVVIGYDARHGSHSFAHDSAAVLAAAGFDARVLPRALPTPVLAFAVRSVGAVAGVMVTASHNPPRDNGYKVYAGDGAQIVPPMDSEIEAAIAAVGPTDQIPLTAPVGEPGASLGPSASPSVLPESLVEDYVASVAALLAPGSPRGLALVHTSLHGVGGATLQAVLSAAGFDPAGEVPEQAEPDPDFPTVAFPNPEEAGAMDLALALARREGADLVIANDPDADRCAVGVPAGAGWRMLSGDEVGVLLADALMAAGRSGTYATTIVSSTMLSRMAAARGAPFAETLTGFKWIARAAPDLAYGYEEALGYAVAPGLVRDKDGISAAVVIAELAATLLARGSSLAERLEELYAEFGRHATRQLSWRVADPARIAEAMRQARRLPVRELAGQSVEVADRWPANDVLTWRFEGGRVVLRPSGTEPKCKAYLELAWPPGVPVAPEEVTRQLDSLAAEVTRVIDL